MNIIHAQKSIAVDSIQIPDLWHIAQAELDLDCKRAILTTWHLAHDMHKALLESPDLLAERDQLKERNRILLNTLKSATAWIRQSGGDCLTLDSIIAGQLPINPLTPPKDDLIPSPKDQDVIES